MPHLQSLGLYSSFTNSDFLEFQETSTLSWTRFLAIFFGFEAIQTLALPQGSVETLPFGHRFNSLGAGAI